MSVLVVRHGEAIDPARAPSDEVRHLSARGRAVTRAVGEKLLERGLVPAWIYTSPLVRAVQTAEILASATGYAGEIVVHEPLVPGAPTSRAVSVLAEHGDDEVIVLVSHEPTVRALAGHLSGLGRSFPGFSPSAVAVIANGALLARLDPHTLAWRAPDDLGP
jgi:phosphohistidine phosphatase